VRLLEKHGHDVMVACNGRDAVHAVREWPFDLVLMDVQMPEMSGLEAAAAIRAREESTGGRIPIIALTAHAMKGDREQCLAAGMDDYVSKPIHAEELYKAVARWAPPVPSTKTSEPRINSAAARAGDPNPNLALALNPLPNLNLDLTPSLPPCGCGLAELT
jgi:CheY-like chemotaxis protein